MSIWKVGRVPILYAPDAKGNLHYIDDVENGLACGCFCPSPSCGAPLVARNKGSVLIHHFAHKGGTGCKYALETTLTLLAKRIIEENGFFYLPECNLLDGSTVKEQTLPVNKVECVDIDKDKRPALSVICQAGDEELELLFLVMWEAQYIRAESTHIDIVAADLSTFYRVWESEYLCDPDAQPFALKIQTSEVVEKMVSGPCYGVRWLYHHRFEQIKAEKLKQWAEERSECERQRKEEREKRERAWLSQQKIEEQKQAARKAKEENRLKKMEDFCECNGLTLLEVTGAGRVVECPYLNKQISFGQTDYGCCVCDALVQDFRTHIACAATDE